MLIENTFTVARPVEEVWAFMLDVEKIAPCMPGAELTETVDDHTWKGKVNMAFGPVKMAFAGSVTMEERDDAAHRVVLKAKGTEAKGKGALHHLFVEDTAGGVLVIDEWESEAAFQAFFANQADIPQVAAAAGVNGPPTSTAYRILDTPDRF